MKKIHLSEGEKHILQTLIKSPHYECDRDDFNLSDKDFDTNIRLLISRGMVKSYTETHEVGFLDCELTEIGVAYFNFNPTLSNPPTEEELKQEASKSKMREHIFDILKILLGAIIGAAITHFFG